MTTKHAVGPRSWASLARPVTTKRRRPGGLSGRNAFPRSSGGQPCKVKMLASVVPPEASLLGFGMAAFFLGPHAISPPCASASQTLLIKTPDGGSRATQ